VIKIRKRLYFTTYLLILISLGGCQRPTNYVVADRHKQQLPKHVSGTSDDKATKARITLNAKCINIQSVGEDYLISIPSANLFATQTPRIVPNAYPILDEVLTFMKHYRKVAIYVNSYVNPYVSSDRAQALTLARARNIADYFVSQGLDARIIFTNGFGSAHPISHEKSYTDDAPNSRIEITFRDAVV
jgi:intracellular multiplication protein IcmN